MLISSKCTGDCRYVDYILYSYWYCMNENPAYPIFLYETMSHDDSLPCEGCYLYLILLVGGNILEIFLIVDICLLLMIIVSGNYILLSYLILELSLVLHLCYN